MGWQRVRHDWVTKHAHTHAHTPSGCVFTKKKKKKRRRRSIISGKHSYTEDMHFWPLHLIWLLFLSSSLKSVSAWIYYANIAFLGSCSIHQNYSSPFTQNIWEEYSELPRVQQGWKQGMRQLSEVGKLFSNILFSLSPFSRALTWDPIILQTSY